MESILKNFPCDKVGEKDVEERVAYQIVREHDGDHLPPPLLEEDFEPRFPDDRNTVQNEELVPPEQKACPESVDSRIKDPLHTRSIVSQGKKGTS